MDVDQTRHGEGTTEIEDLAAVAGHRLDIGVGSDDQEFPILDCHRFSPRPGLVDGVNPTVGVNGVGNFTRGLRAADTEHYHDSLGKTMYVSCHVSLP